MTDKIYLAIIDHRYATDTHAHRTREGAVKSVADFAREWWDDDRADRTIESHEGMDDSDVIDAYFDGNEREFYRVENVRLED